VRKLYEDIQIKITEKISPKKIDEVAARIFQNAEKNLRESAEYISTEFASIGLLISYEDAKKLAKKTNFTLENIKEKIKEMDLERRFKAFSSRPSVDALINDEELLETMAKAIKDPNHEFTKKIKSQFKELTLEQVSQSIRGIKIRAKWMRVWKMLTSWKTIVAFLGFVILVIAAVMGYASYKRSQFVKHY